MARLNLFIEQMITHRNNRVILNLESSKTSDKLLKALELFRPHINGHKTAINLFNEALEEVREMERNVVSKTTELKEIPKFKS